MKYPQIRRAKAIDDVTLIVEFTSYEVKNYSILHLLNNPMFSLLRQPAFFKRFEIEQGGYGIVWNEEIDISEYELWKNGVTLANGNSFDDVCNYITDEREIELNESLNS